MKKISWFVNAFIITLTVVLVGGFALSLTPYLALNDPLHPLIGEETPELVYPSIENGAAIDLNFDNGQELSYVHFFASWCGRCVMEHDDLMAISDALRDKVHMIGIASQDRPSGTKSMLDAHSNPFETIIADRSAHITNSWKVKGIPSSFIVSPTGQICSSYVGVIGHKDIIGDYDDWIEECK